MGIMTIDKRFVHKKSHTTAALTKQGKQRIDAHWKQLDRVKKL
ncbi:MAG: Regulatory protein ArsR, partial [Ilumatobacteraceae bacterium]|nr:Regulatory protein ArsR [Ilumatobacteraceae bacterium]